MKKQAQLQLIWICLFGAINFGAYGQVQIGQDIDGEAAGDWSGWSVSLSSDGSILVIGAWLNNGNGQYSGHVRVYGKVKDPQSQAGFTWEQLGEDIDGEATNDSAARVSLSSDGSVLAIGAGLNDGNGQRSGHVRVYGKVVDAQSRGGFTWEKIGEDIDGEVEGDQSGNSVSLSSDGSVLAIGAGLNDGNGEDSGHVRVYGKVENAPSPGGFKWEQLGEDIDGEAEGDYSGTSVSLSADGSVLAIGASRNGDWSGHVRVYGKVVDTQSPGGFTWEQLGEDINGEAEGDRSGSSISLSADGSLLAIGAWGNDGNGDRSGHTRVYHTGPSVSIEGAPVHVNARDPFEVTFTFDRGVTGFNEEDIAVTHATVDNFTPVDAFTYTATLAPDVSTCGHIAINVPAGAAFDGANISNFADQEVIVEVVDDVPPDVVTKDITVALGINGQVVINADQINDGSTDNCGVAAMFIRSNQVISSEGIFDVELIVEDVNGNRASDFARVTVEASPTVSIDNFPSGVEDLSPFTVEIVFSKAVTGFRADDIQVTNAMVSALTGSGSTYTATLVSTPLCDDITIDVPANVATVANSLLNLPNLAASQVRVGVVDTMTPTITSCPANVVANTADNGTGDCTTTVDLGSPVTEDNCSVATVVARVNGTDIDPNSYAFSTGTTMVTWFVSDDTGNTASCEQTVTVEANEDCEAAPSFSPLIPTAFTPNGDGANDVWIIDNLSEDASVKIYDRHGTIIFRSDAGYTHPWDGTYRDSSLPAGPYLYLIQSGSHKYTGTVTILL